MVTVNSMSNSHRQSLVDESQEYMHICWQSYEDLGVAKVIQEWVSALSLAFAHLQGAVWIIPTGEMGYAYGTAS